MPLAPKNALARGAKLAAARKARRFSQEQAAEHLGVDRASISRWERGSEVSADNLAKLAELYGVTIDSLRDADPTP